MSRKASIDRKTKETQIKATVDLDGTGACDPDPGTAPVLTCTPNQIRKVNVRLAGRSAEPDHASRLFFRNSLNTQVSLRSLALVNRYM